MYGHSDLRYRRQGGKKVTISNSTQHQSMRYFMEHRDLADGLGLELASFYYKLPCDLTLYSFENTRNFR